MGDKAPIDFDALDAAEESFRPSWDVGEPEDPITTVSTAQPTFEDKAPRIVPSPAIIVGAPVIAIGEAAPDTQPIPQFQPPPSKSTSPGVAPPAVGSSPQPVIPSTPPQAAPRLGSTMVGGTFQPISQPPPPAPSAPPLPAPSVPPVAFKTVEASARSSRSAPPIPFTAVDPFRAAAPAVDDDYVLPKKSGGKGLIFGALGFVAVIGIGAFVKFGLMSADAKTATTTATTASVSQPSTPAPATADIPPPPDKEELAAAASASAAEAPPPPPDPVKTADPTPDPTPAPVTTHHPKVATAPPPAPAPKPHAPPAPASKPPPAGKSGGIVRDSPF